MIRHDNVSKAEERYAPPTHGQPFQYQGGFVLAHEGNVPPLMHRNKEDSAGYQQTPNIRHCVIVAARDASSNRRRAQDTKAVPWLAAGE
jgi:hypothetical protein